MKIASSLALCVAVALLAVVSLQAQNVTGSGTAGTIPEWASSSKLGNSIISESGTDVSVKGTVEADGSTSYGVYGRSDSDAGVYGVSDSLYGVEGFSSSASGVGVYGHGVGVGVKGVSSSDAGVYGQSTSGAGVSGSSTSDAGVYGFSDSLYGVQGVSTNSRGVQGESMGVKSGVAGMSTGGDGVGGIGCGDCSGASGIYGMGYYAGGFEGKVQVNGNLTVTGVKAFHIDHPLDPANKYLNHFAIESNEVLNTYSGNVTTDMGGTAAVELPEYFEAVSTNYRYQLTVIGQFAQAIIFEEIKNNRFVIKTDKPSVKVSWQVTGVRSDAYAKAHAVPVEEEKPAQERGYYLAPELFGQPEEMSLAWLYHADLMRDAKALEEKRKAQGLAAQPQ